MLSITNPAVYISNFKKRSDVAEIFTVEEFSGTLINKKFWNLEILNNFYRSADFLKSETRDRKILIDFLHINAVCEIAFHKNIIIIRIKDNMEWQEILAQIDEILKEHQIYLKS